MPNRSVNGANRKEASNLVPPCSERFHDSEMVALVLSESLPCRIRSGLLSKWPLKRSLVALGKASLHVIEKTPDQGKRDVHGTLTRVANRRYGHFLFAAYDKSCKGTNL